MTPETLHQAWPVLAGSAFALLLFVEVLAIARQARRESSEFAPRSRRSRR